MAGMMTPCAGKWELFDSIDPRDHHEAKALCISCPVIAACAQRRDDLLASTTLYSYPEGTWAGRLLAAPTEVTRKRLAATSRAQRIEAEDLRYDDGEARAAHSAYTAGDTSEWAVTGHRVYDRRRKNRSRQDVA